MTTNNRERGLSVHCHQTAQPPLHNAGHHFKICTELSTTPQHGSLGGYKIQTAGNYKQQEKRSPASKQPTTVPPVYRHFLHTTTHLQLLARCFTWCDGDMLLHAGRPQLTMLKTAMTDTTQVQKHYSDSDGSRGLVGRASCGAMFNPPTNCPCTAVSLGSQSTPAYLSSV
jgi:hypothetical protein